MVLTMSEKLNIAEMTVSEVEVVIASFESVCQEALDIIEEWMPVVMANFSQEIWSASWLDTLHVELPKMVPSVAKAAGLLGQIPAWDDNALEDSDGYQLSWKPYTPDVS
jgi:hypothetical protein